MAPPLRHLRLPDDATSNAAAAAVAALAPHVRKVEAAATDRVALSVDDGVVVDVPAEALVLLVQVLDELAHGNAVTVAPVTSEMTTQQAADLLNVSRPHLVSLLEGGAMPFRRVGNRRKVRLVDVLAYQRASDADRRAALDLLTAEAEQLDEFAPPS